MRKLNARLPPDHRTDHEALRRSFLPKQVRILFVGESPPASGRFFYCGNSGLYRAIREVFQAADPAISDEDFLYAFKRCGCYLIDLCAEPVDRLDPLARRTAYVAGVNSLTTQVKGLRPQMVVSLVRSTRSHIARALANADWQGPILDVPYPGRWVRHREIFSGKLLPYVKAVLRNSEFIPGDLHVGL